MARVAGVPPYDVIVVGAGPAGSATVRECSRQGKSVLLLDKAEFPRDKPCGGGGTARARDLLPFDVSPVVEQTIDRVRFNFRQTARITRHSDRPLAHLTQRRRLDAFLLEQALEKGVTLRERARVREVHQDSDPISVRTSDETFRGRAVVAVDGCAGRTARLAGVETVCRNQIALEDNLHLGKDELSEWQETIGLHAAWWKEGCGWILPKSDRLDIGAAGWKLGHAVLRRSLARLAQFYGCAREAVEDTKRNPIPWRAASSPPERGRLQLVGAAAGLVNPISDEGTFAAFWSGTTAARHLARVVAGEARDRHGYRPAVQQRLGSDIEGSQRLRDFVHFLPKLVVNLERHGTFFTPDALDMVLGNQTFRHLRKKYKRLMPIVELVSHFVRSTEAHRLRRRPAGAFDSIRPFG